jgi:hypothetical protein
LFGGAFPDRHPGGEVCEAVIGADDVGHDGQVGDAQALNEPPHLTPLRGLHRCSAYL